MKTGRRILAVVLMFLSVLLVLLCIGGIVGTWTVGNALTDGIVTVLSGVETALETMDSALSRLNTGIGNARDEVASFEQVVVTAAEDFSEKPVILATLSEKLDLGIAPAVLRVRETVQSVRETVIGIQNTVQAVNALPFISVGQNLPGNDRLVEMSDGVAELTGAVEEMRDSVRETKAEAAAQVVFRIGRASSRLDTGLKTVETAVTGAAGQVSGLHSEVLSLKSKVALWLDLGAAAITLILLWVVFSQVVTFALGLSVYQGRNLFARWLSPLPEEQSEAHSEPETAITEGD